MASGAGASDAVAKFRGGGAVALAMFVLNITTYGFVIAAAHILGPDDYGALAAWMNLLLVVNVGSLGTAGDDGPAAVVREGRSGRRSSHSSSG